MVKRKIGNVKVRNATPVEIDGIKFRSKLEAFTYSECKRLGIPVYYEQERFTLIPGFVYDDEKVRPITILPDFTGDGFIIECKGNPNDAFPLRWKLLKYHLYQTNQNRKLYIVRSQKDVSSLLSKLTITCQTSNLNTTERQIESNQVM